MTASRMRSLAPNAHGSSHAATRHCSCCRRRIERAWRRAQVARAHVPVIVVDSSASNAARWSRHARTHRAESFKGCAFDECLVRLAKSPNHRPVLLLTDEFAVHSMSQHRDMPAPHLRFRLPPDATAKLSATRRCSLNLPPKIRFCVPNTAMLNTVKDRASRRPALSRCGQAHRQAPRAHWCGACPNAIRVRVTISRYPAAPAIDPAWT